MSRFWDSVLLTLALIAGFYLLFIIGKLVFQLVHRQYDLHRELVEKHNTALALALTGYYLGLVLAIGGALVGPSRGILSDLMDLGIYGLLSIILLNLSWIICDKFILFKFNISDELLRDRNVGTGAVSAGMSLATGFIIYGSVSGEGGGIVTALGFWALGQLILILAGLVYELITPYNIHKEIERDNVAVGVSFGGLLMAVGMIIGLAGEQDFESWGQSLPQYFIYCAVGLVLLPLIRLLTDWLLLPRVTLSKAVAHPETPNVGLSFFEAFSYVAAALVINWCV